MLIIYLWSLLIAPFDKTICTIWAAEWTRAAIIQACGTQVADELPRYIANLVQIESGNSLDLPASELVSTRIYTPSRYMVSIVWQDFSPVICTIAGTRDAPPTRSDVASNCPTGLAEYDAMNTVWRGPFSTEQAAPSAASCQLAVVAQPAMADMATSVTYELLEYKLRWFSQGDGLTWQNQFDQEILSAGSATNVPAKLIKAVIAAETQFWPLAVGPNDEHGMIQVTDDGADLALRYSDDLYQDACSRALHSQWCQYTYAMLSSDHRTLVRQALLADLACIHCSLVDAVRSARQDVITYARILSAYRCYSLELRPGAGWDVTLAVYHSGGECVKGDQICWDGQEYSKIIQ